MLTSVVTYWSHHSIQHFCLCYMESSPTARGFNYLHSTWRLYYIVCSFKSTLVEGGSRSLSSKWICWDGSWARSEKESSAHTCYSILPVTASMTAHVMLATASNFIHILSCFSSIHSVWMLLAALQIQKQVHREASVVVITIILSLGTTSSCIQALEAWRTEGNICLPSFIMRRMHGWS